MSTRPGISNIIHTFDAEAPETLIGRVLEARFRLDEIISTGGMGVVYRATQLNVSRPVAVKIMRPELASDPGLMTRFVQETEVIGKLSHPNIVPLIDSGRELAGIAFYVMEYVEGETFRESLRSLKLSLLDILHVFIQVCDALIEAHHFGIIHRDLKFDNIMIVRHQDNRIHVKVLDFGVARQLSQNHRLTRSGEVPGTPGIIAPELVDRDEPTPRSDLYSLGILMFTAFTGKAPFTGQNDFEVMHAHKHDEIPNLYELVGDRVPEVVLDLARELMEKDPNMRPQTAEVVRDRLEKIIRQLERQMMDHPRYVPPSHDGLRPLHPPKRSPSPRSHEFLTQNGTAKHAPVESPPVAPLSIVGMLIGLVIVLVLVIIYLLFKQHTG